MAWDLRARAREWFERVWNGRDEAAILEFASPDVVSFGLGSDGRPAIGVEQLKVFRRSFLSAFPDLHVRVEDVILDGDRTAVRLSFTGTHNGEGIGIPPTGRAYVCSAIVIMHWREGKIVQAWNEFDGLGMMRQLQNPSARLKA